MLEQKCHVSYCSSDISCHKDCVVIRGSDHVISLDDLNASSDRSSSQMDLLTNARLLRAFGFNTNNGYLKGKVPPTTSLPPDIPPVDNAFWSRGKRAEHRIGVDFVSREDATITW